MTIEQYSTQQFGERLARIVTPSTPVTSLEMLHGRAHRLETISRALYATGRSTFIYGDRGVGKSSLAKIAAASIEVVRTTSCILSPGYW